MSDTASIALEYRNRGWCPIPVPPRSKKPTRNGWQLLRLDAAEIRHEFSNGSNIGNILGAPSGGLADVDLDTPEAIRLAAVFLPETPASFGRASAPASHRLYVAPGVASVKYTDPTLSDEDDRKTLVEVRADGRNGRGLHTLFPGSVHPTGEAIAWHSDGDPAQVGPRQLEQAVGRLAAAALLARHCRPVGSRHETMLALAGGLLRAGWGTDRVVWFVEAVATTAGHENVEDRVQGVRDTALRLAGGEKVNGWPHLATLVGDQVVDRARGWLGLHEMVPSDKKLTAPAPSGPADDTAGVVRLTDIQMRSIQWLDKPLWQRAAFHLLAGVKGAGKGTFLALLAAQVTRGIGGHPPRNVLFISSEDSASIDLKPRLVAAGADVGRCYLVTRHVQLPSDIDWLREQAEAIGACGLLVIDPVANHIGARNSNSEAEVRDAVAPLNKLADELDCTLIGVRHVGKDRSRGALASILGSTAWVDTPRVVVMVVVDDEQDDIRHIQVVAGNRTRGRAGVMFRVEGVTLGGLSEEVTRAVALGESTKDIDDLLQPAEKPTSKSGKAKALILDMLEASPALAMESDELDAAVAQAAGVTAKTVRNLRGDLVKECLIRSRPDLDEHGHPTRWMVLRTSAVRP